MRIAICDDEELYRVELKTILDKLLINVDYNIDTFDDGNRLIESFKAQPYDILFLDIENRKRSLSYSLPAMSNMRSKATKSMH